MTYVSFDDSNLADRISGSSISLSFGLGGTEYDYNPSVPLNIVRNRLVLSKPVTHHFLM